jgi:hypothetical protein
MYTNRRTGKNRHVIESEPTALCLSIGIGLGILKLFISQGD